MAVGSPKRNIIFLNIYLMSFRFIYLASRNEERTWILTNLSEGSRLSSSTTLRVTMSSGRLNGKNLFYTYYFLPS
jgi:hypothetical protein